MRLSKRFRRADEAGEYALTDVQSELDKRGRIKAPFRFASWAAQKLTDAVANEGGAALAAGAGADSRTPQPAEWFVSVSEQVAARAQLIVSMQSELREQVGAAVGRARRADAAAATDDGDGAAAAAAGGLAAPLAAGGGRVALTKAQQRAAVAAEAATAASGSRTTRWAAMYTELVAACERGEQDPDILSRILALPLDANATPRSPARTGSVMPTRTRTVRADGSGDAGVDRLASEPRAMADGGDAADATRGRELSTDATAAAEARSALEDLLETLAPLLCAGRDTALHDRLMHDDERGGDGGGGVDDNWHAFAASADDGELDRGAFQRDGAGGDGGLGGGEHDGTTDGRQPPAAHDDGGGLDETEAATHAAIAASLLDPPPSGRAGVCADGAHAGAQRQVREGALPPSAFILDLTRLDGFEVDAAEAFARPREIAHAADGGARPAAPATHHSHGGGGETSGAAGGAFSAEQRGRDDDAPSPRRGQPAVAHARAQAAPAAGAARGPTSVLAPRFAPLDFAPQPVARARAGRRASTGRSAVVADPSRLLLPPFEFQEQLGWSADARACAPAGTPLLLLAAIAPGQRAWERPRLCSIDRTPPSADARSASTVGRLRALRLRFPQPRAVGRSSKRGADDDGGGGGGGGGSVLDLSIYLYGSQGGAPINLAALAAAALEGVRIGAALSWQGMRAEAQRAASADALAPRASGADGGGGDEVDLLQPIIATRVQQAEDNLELEGAPWRLGDDDGVGGADGYAAARAAERRSDARADAAAAGAADDFMSPHRDDDGGGVCGGGDGEDGDAAGSPAPTVITPIAPSRPAGLSPLARAAPLPTVAELSASLLRAVVSLSAAGEARGGEATPCLQVVSPLPPPSSAAADDERARALRARQLLAACFLATTVNQARDRDRAAPSAAPVSTLGAWLGPTAAPLGAAAAGVRLAQAAGPAPTGVALRLDAARPPRDVDERPARPPQRAALTAADDSCPFGEGGLDQPNEPLDEPPEDARMRENTAAADDGE